MQKRCTEDPRVAETLKKLVQERGQKRWPEIAKVLETLHNIKIDIPFHLKAIYQDIMNPNPGLSTEQNRLLISLAIKYRSVIRLALPEFQKETGMDISRHKFTSRLYRHYKIAILAGIQAFIRNKSEYRKRLTRFPGQSIGKVLQCKELKSDDPFTMKLKEMADQLETLLQCLLDNHENDSVQLYRFISTRMTRKGFFLLLNCISFMDDLRCISLNVLKDDEELMPDYFLQPTIEENKQLHVYKCLFLDDLQIKYQMYTDSTDIHENIESKYFWNNAILQPKAVITKKNPKLKTVRGKITVNDKKYPSDKTIRFDIPEEESENERYEIDFNKRQKFF